MLSGLIYIGHENANTNNRREPFNCLGLLRFEGLNKIDDKNYTLILGS